MMPETYFGAPAVTADDVNRPQTANGLIAEFFRDAVQDDAATAETGRPIFVDRDHIEIRIAGNLKEIRRREVRPSDKKRFPREWLAYQQGLENPTIGTPLSTLPFLLRSQVKEYEAIGIKTAEQFVNISDAETGKFMGFQQLKQRMVDFLAAAAGHAPLSEMRSKLEQVEAERVAERAERAAEKQQMADLLARVEAAESRAAGKGGK